LSAPAISEKNHLEKCKFQVSGRLKAVDHNTIKGGCFMKKKLLAMLSCAALLAASVTGCSSSKPAESAAAPAAGSEATSEAAAEADAPSKDVKIALITMDSIDQHWVTLNEGAQKAAAELGVSVTFMSPNTKDDAQQIECVNNAVAGGYQAIIVAANGPDAISSALKEASSSGVKIVYVDSPANVDAEATFSTDNEAAGKTAGEEMIKALEAAGVTSGKIGIVNVNAATDSTVKRENGFRSAFEGKGYELMETQYGEGDAAKSQTIAENYITQGVVGIFGCNEGSTTGTGNAIKASGSSDIIGVGFDKSDAILNLIDDGYLLCTMAQNPDVMGEEGVKAAVKAINGESLGGKVTDTGVSAIKAGGSTAAAPAAAAGEAVTASQEWKIALITMDSIDQHWVTLNEGAQETAKELGVSVTFMSPNTKDDAQQIECVNNAVAGGYQAIIVAANGPDAISSALKEASSSGVKIVYVDSPANVDAEATFSTDNEAAGKTAGEEMIKALEAAGVTSGKIGIVNVNAATDSTVKRENGFRSAFEGKGFELMETQYGEGDAAKSQTIAENYITQGVVGIFGCNEGSTTGTGNAIKASGNSKIVGVGFDKSDAIMNLINDGYLLCTMAQNPDVMGKEGVKAAVKALEGDSLGGAVQDTGVSVLTK
jgi:ribose transport system substrate-binding protein